MRNERDPVNSNPFQLIAELKEVAPNSPLTHVAQMFMENPLERLDLRQAESHPRLPNREWTNKELDEISRWLHEIRGIVEGCIPALAEVLTYPNATEENRDEYHILLKLSSYLELVSVQVTEQKGIVLSREAQAKAALLGVIPDPRARALVQAQLSRPGEA